jgi:hypothetical protein
MEPFTATATAVKVKGCSMEKTSKQLQKEETRVAVELRAGKGAHLRQRSKTEGTVVATQQE